MIICEYCRYWLGEYGCQCPDQDCEHCTRDDVPKLYKRDSCKGCEYDGDCSNCIRGEDQ